MTHARTLASIGLVVSILAWPAFWLFIGASLGEVFVEDANEQARLMAEKELMSYLTGAYFLLSLPVSGWIAGHTYREARALSILTMISTVGIILVIFSTPMWE